MEEEKSPALRCLEIIKEGDNLSSGIYADKISVSDFARYIG